MTDHNFLHLGSEMIKALAVCRAAKTKATSEVPILRARSATILTTMPASTSHLRPIMNVRSHLQSAAVTVVSDHSTLLACAGTNRTNSDEAIKSLLSP